MRHRLTALCIGGLLAAATIGCGDDADPSSAQEATMDVTEAREALKTLLTETAEAVAPDATVEVINDRSPSPCRSDQTGAELGTESAKLVLAVAVETGTERSALQDVVAEWERAEVDLDLSRVDDPDAEVLGKRPGFGVRGLAVADSGQLALTGETDCLSPGGG